MKIYTQEGLKEILKQHKLWLADSNTGSRANLRSADQRSANLRSANLRSADLYGADLSGADLYGADLSGADLYGADLRSANLRSADLSGANLRSADLSGADQRSANLRSANLRSADLRSANLRSADLSGADLRSADLRSANLRSANLSGANLSGAKMPFFQIPQTGNLTVWKKCAGGVVVELRVPARAKRTATPTGRRCRAEFVRVIKIHGGKRALSTYLGTFEYRVGKIVRPDSYNDDIRLEYTNGIHFFLTREEAEAY